jgi:putative ABC transport system substrate-binding protein
MQKLTQTIPIIFAGGGDPTANGLVKNIARPESNVTGFPATEPSIAGKQLGLLKEAAPRVGRVAVIFNPDTGVAVFPGLIAAIEAAAPALSVEILRTPVRNAVDIVRAIDAFAAMPNGGLLILPPPPTAADLGVMVQLEAQYRLPAVYTGDRSMAGAGALISYGSDRVDVYRRAADYVDRILRGAKISELPVQFPTKYDLVINLKTAKAIGLAIPESLLLRADEVIE